ncbi:MAG: gliding motility-associated C-terminal domain-containing protein [Bacteroidota bacterium]|nr:gliding motility-associated C-terminal domain-containing protein [Bacteroidota bacterium]
MLVVKFFYRKLSNFRIIVLCFLTVFFYSESLFANSSINVIESPCFINLLSVQNISCYGGANGIIELSGSGGNVGSYHYTISSFNPSLNVWMQFGQSPLTSYTSNNVIFPLLSADSLRIIMNDSLGCGDTLYLSLMQPNSPISINYSSFNTSTLFTNDGSISTTITGGSPNYFYSWIGPNGFTSNTQNINNLFSGVYRLTVTDSLGCIDTQTVVISSNQNCFAGNYFPESLSCFGDSSGVINVTGVFGTPSFYYNLEREDGGVFTSISNTITVDTFLVFNNLIAGNYRCVITDSLNCLDTSLLIVITEPSSINTTPTIINSSLQGICDGLISLNTSGGTVPYSYAWNTGDTTSYIDSLCSGLYCANISDANGCIVNWCDSIIILDSCITGIQLDVSSSPETCFGQDGSITIVASQGFAPYFYSLDGGFFFSSSSFSDTIVIDLLASATYNISIMDSLGCVEHYGNFFLDSTPNPVIDSIVTQNESCCGNDGQLFIFVSSSNTMLQYSLDTSNVWQYSSNFDSLFMGNYVVYVQDGNGCFDTVAIQLSSDSIANLNIITEKTDIRCYGENNGTFKVHDPDDCYEYVLWRYTFLGTQVPLDTGVYFNELISGFYGVIATSNSGHCIDSSYVIKYIQEPDIITYSSVEEAVYCINNDSCNGSIQLSHSPSGGVSPYHYYVTELFSNIPLGLISTDSMFSQLCPGNYLIDVVDANGCIIQDTAVIRDSSLYIDSIIGTNISCYGESDGIAIAYTHGGVGNLSYLWSNSQNTQIIDSLSRGLYILTVNDSVGCYMRDSVFIEHPDTLLFKIRQNGKISETCLGVSYDGQILLEISGGTLPYTHSWTTSSGISGSGLGDTIFNLTADTLMLYVQDINGCIGSPSWGTVNITILQALNQDNPLSIDTVLTNINPICYETSDGNINIHVFSGDNPYEFSIDAGLHFSNDSNFSNLPAGTYDIMVLDMYGCADSSEVRIEEYNDIIINIDSIKHVSCYEGSDGYISISASQGSGSYTYLWSPTLDTDSVILNLEAYAYGVSVTDSAGCMQIDTISIYEMTNPIQSIETIIQNVQCHSGNDGSASIQVIGGMPFENGSYTCYWIDLNNDTVSLSNLANNLESGLFTIIISDSFNCGPFIDTVTIEEPDRFVLSITTIQDNICFGDLEGMITVQANGGSLSYNDYFLFNDNLVINQASPVFTNLGADIFSIWATDSNGCISDTIKDIKLGEPGRINVTALVQETSCFETTDGNLEIIVIGGTSPYDYILLHGNDSISQGVVTQGNTESIHNLHAGSFTFSINDINGCVADTLLSVSSPAQVVSDFSSDIIYGTRPLLVNFMNQSSGADIFIWDFNNNQPSLISSNLNESIQNIFDIAGQYKVSLIASNSELSNRCNDTSFLIINVEGYSMYNVFTPNNDLINDSFDFDDWGLSSLAVQIFNRWGQQVYELDINNKIWNGKGYNGEDLPEGVYYFYLQAIGNSGADINETGNITLLR